MPAACPQHARSMPPELSTQSRPACCPVLFTAPRPLRPLRPVMASLATVVLAVLVVAVFALLSRLLRGYWRFRKLELAIPGPASLPLLGNLLDMAGVTEAGKLDALQAMWGERRGDISRFALANHMLVFVSDPDDIGMVMREKRFATKPFLFYGFMKTLLGNGLTVSSGALWKAHRAWVQPAFHQDVLDRFVDVFSEEAARWMRGVRDASGAGTPADEVEIVNAMRHLTATCALRTGLTFTLRAEDKPVLQEVIDGIQPMLSIINTRSFQPWLWPPAIFNLTPGGRRIRAFRSLAESFMRGILARNRDAFQDRRRARDEDYMKQRKTFIDIVLDTEEERDARFSDADILDETKTFFSTATEITASALGLVFKMLSIRTDVQDRVVDELKGVFGDSGRNVDKEDLAKLPYLECVIKETLRLLPAIPFVARELQEDTEFNGKTVPAGSTLLIHILGAHRDPRHHPDPLSFDPERFAGERAAAMHPYCFIPFSGGPRACLGQRYAMMQLKTVLATVLRGLRVEAVDDGLTDPSRFPLTFDMTLRIVGGNRVRLAPR